MAGRTNTSLVPREAMFTKMTRASCVKYHEEPELDYTANDYGRRAFKKNVMSFTIFSIE